MINVTEPAAREIERLLTDKNPEGKGGMRFFVKGGGCSGLSYGMDLVDEGEEKDKSFDVEGIHIYVDPKSYLFLNGTTIDFKESLMGRGFTFENPNASNSCGCGTSFSV